MSTMEAAPIRVFKDEACILPAVRCCTHVSLLLLLLPWYAMFVCRRLGRVFVFVALVQQYCCHITQLTSELEKYLL